MIFVEIIYRGSVHSKKSLSLRQNLMENNKWLAQRLKEFRINSCVYPNSHIFVRPKRMWLFGYLWLFGGDYLETLQYLYNVNQIVIHLLLISRNLLSSFKDDFCLKYYGHIWFILYLYIFQRDLWGIARSRG